MKWLSPLFLLALAAPETLPPPQETQDEQVYTDDIHKDFVEKIRKAIDERKWPQLFARYEEAQRKYSQKLIAHPERPELRISLPEWLLLKFSDLPAEALEHYRTENDTRARLAFDKAVEDGDPAILQKTLWTYFFASSTDEVLDRLGQQHFDRGRFDHAIVYWNWLLRYYPDSGIPKPVTAARIAVACRLAGARSTFEELKAHLRKARIDGDVVVGRETQRLSAFLAGIAIEVPEPGATASLKTPAIPEPEDRHRRRIVGVRNDIRRWVYDFAADKGETGGKSEPTERTVSRRVRWDVQAAAVVPDFPYLPAYARIGTSEYIVATNGLRVIAVNPGGLKGESVVAGVYWKYPENGPVQHLPVTSSYSGYYFFSLPHIGVTIDGEHAFATLYSDRPRRDTNPQTMDLFDGPTRLVCFHIPSGRVVWDTDRLEAQFRAFDFVDRNFAFSAPPLVKGGLVYAGLCTSPVGEEESRLLCLDRATGRPLWCTSISSVTGGARNLMYGSGQKIPVHLTLLTEEAGVVYAQTSLGTVAAIDAVTGSIRWLALYKRVARRPQYNQQEPLTLRPPNPPRLYRGTLYVLPQDAYELMAFDAVTGARVELPPAKVHDRDVQWRSVSHLLGIVKGWMILGGAETYVVRMHDYKAFTLPLVNTSRSGLGTLVGETAYFPAWSESGGELAIYHGAGSWMQLAQAKWKGKDECGNLLVAGEFLVVHSNRLIVYTDTERVRQEYILRVNQTPPDLETLLEYGGIMRENDKLEDAAEAYLDFVRGAEGDPKWEKKVREVRVELYEIFTRRGEEAAKSDDGDGPRRALQFHQKARDFSYDPATWADSTRRVARAHEKLSQWKEAVAEYQSLLRRAKDRTVREEGSSTVETVWLHARRKIAEIMAIESESYAAVEKEAAEQLRKIREGDVEALRELRELYPNSKSARDAWKRMYEEYLKRGLWDKVRALLEEFKSWYGSESGFEHRMRVLELLDRIGDTDRIVRELRLLAKEHPKQRISSSEERETVAEYVERRLREFEKRTRLDGTPVREPLAKIGEFEAAVAGQGPRGLPVGTVPLRPLGIVPPDFPSRYELFSRGSSIELWDLGARRRLWARPHPGGYVGIVYQAPKELGAQGVAVVEVIPGSPAARAGFKAGDVILEIGGSPVTAESFGRDLRGPRVGVAFVREGRRFHADCEVESWPVSVRPSIVGAAFTRDYELAVAWEDGVGAIELASGRLLWFFQGIRDRFHVSALHATDGRLLVSETYRADRGRPMRVRAGPSDRRPMFEAEDAHHRLICLDDFTGRVAWIRAFEIAPNGQGARAMTPHVAYFSERVAVVESGNRGVSADVLLSVVGVEDGQLAGGGKPVSLGGAVPAIAVDLESEVLYYVDVRDGSNRVLRSVALDPARPCKPLEIALNAKYVEPATTVLQLLFDSGRLFVASSAADGASRIWVLDARDGRELYAIALPEERSIPPIAGGCAHVEDGVLYVYNVQRMMQSGGTLPPGFLTAYRGAQILWDAVAPSLPRDHRTRPRIEAGMKDLVALYAARGGAPRESGESPIAALYSARNGGYLRMLFPDLSPLPEIDPLVFRRGRLYVNSRGGLQIYGSGE